MEKNEFYFNNSNLEGDELPETNKEEKLLDRQEEYSENRDIENPKVEKVNFPAPEKFIEILEENTSEEYVEAYKIVLDICKAVKEAGGKALLVGGSVRDTIIGKISKDFDLEIYGLESDKVEEIVSDFGNVIDVGKAFGILKISRGGGVDIDISLPRIDSKIGEGHRGFEVKTNPNMSVEEAAKRRDFTMNSISADPLTGEIFDPFGGIGDLKKRQLKITDEERFRDDPLRVMRALQFIGRFGLRLEGESERIIKEMAGQLKELPKERIMEEWKKLLLKSEIPSLGLIAGMNLGVFEAIHPEFPPLTETPQDSEWHPEGDVWMHTLKTVDSAAQILGREEIDEDSAFSVIMAALCHDLGKPLVTKKNETGQIVSYGHEERGKEPTYNFLESLGVDKLTQKKVIQLVANHLMPTLLYEQNIANKNLPENGGVSDGAIRRLATKVNPATIKELVLVAQADHFGRGPFEDLKTPGQLLLPPFSYPPRKWLEKRAKDIGVEKSKPTPLTRGQDWISFGLKPGKEIGRLIELADQLRDNKGWESYQVFEAVEGLATPDSMIKKLEECLSDE